MYSSPLPCSTPPSTPVASELSAQKVLPEIDFHNPSNSTKVFPKGSESCMPYHKSEDMLQNCHKGEVTVSSVSKPSNCTAATDNGHLFGINLADVEEKLNSIKIDSEGNQLIPPTQSLCNGTTTPACSPLNEERLSIQDQPSVVGKDGLLSKPEAIVDQHKVEGEEIFTGDMPLLEHSSDSDESGIKYEVYESEVQMPAIMDLMGKFLSEPYSIYTYRYFIHNWPKLCFLARTQEGSIVGAIVCKLDVHKQCVRRGYIAMLAVDNDVRLKGIGTKLVKKAILAMTKDDCDEVVLETEVDNKAALKLYENLGFVRDKRLFKYYLNGVDAFRLKLWLR